MDSPLSLQTQVKPTKAEISGADPGDMTLGFVDDSTFASTDDDFSSGDDSVQFELPPKEDRHHSLSYCTRSLWRYTCLVLFIVATATGTTLGLLLLTRPQEEKAPSSGDQDTAFRYLIKLRYQLMGAEQHRLVTGDSPMKATAWMAFEDSPRRDLHSPRLEQRFALTTLYFELLGSDWLEPGMDECEWKGVGCNEGLQISSLDLAGNGSSKDYSLPIEIGLLTSLTSLELPRQGRLESPLPTQFGRLTNLEWLSFQGAPPPGLCNLTDELIVNLEGCPNSSVSEECPCCIAGCHNETP